MYDTSFHSLPRACHAGPLRCTPLQVTLKMQVPPIPNFLNIPYSSPNNWEIVHLWGIHGYHIIIFNRFSVSPLLGFQPIATEKLWTFRWSSIGASPPAPLTLLWRGNHSPGGCGVLELDHRLITTICVRVCFCCLMVFLWMWMEYHGNISLYIYRWCHHGIKSSKWGLNPWIIDVSSTNGGLTENLPFLVKHHGN